MCSLSLSISLRWYLKLSLLSFSVSLSLKMATVFFGTLPSPPTRSSETHPTSRSTRHTTPFHPRIFTPWLNHSLHSHPSDSTHCRSVSCKAQTVILPIFQLRFKTKTLEIKNRKKNIFVLLYTYSFSSCEYWVVFLTT